MSISGLYAASASAEYYSYYYGSPTSDMLWPWCHSGGACTDVRTSNYYVIFETSARTINLETVCTYAVETDNTQAGSNVCSKTLAVKDSYCGCAYRKAASRGAFDKLRPKGRARFGAI